MFSGDYRRQLTLPADVKPEDIKAMVELDLQMEEQDVRNYSRHAEIADGLGLTGLKVKLEELAADEYGHARDLRRILKGL